jgi:glycine/D-amino acid oxidase-like deaminating enzyme
LTRSAISRREFVGAVLATPAAGWLSGRSELRTTRRAQGRSDHVVVVGAGAFGGWSALALRRAGLRVTLVDAWGAGNSRASSGGETRVIRTVYNGVALYTEMAARALTLWREAERQWREKIYYQTGALWMCEADDSYVRNSLTQVTAAGLAVAQLSVAEAVRRFPQVNFQDVRSVYFESDAGYLTARAACEMVREQFIREGGTYKQAGAVPLPSAPGSRLQRISLSDGSALDADRFVFACGPWLGSLFPEVIGRRIVPTRQEVFFFGPPAGDSRFDSGSLPVWVHIGARLVYGIPGHDRRGFKVADDTAGPEVDPTSLDRVASTEGMARARAIVRERFPALSNAPIIDARVCQYEASTDGHFLVDRHPQLENVWLVGGGSGHGFKMGPALGEHVASLVQGTAQPYPLFALRRLQPRPS